MIQYTLRCDKDHSFESWFQSAAAFDTLKAKGHLTCAICGSPHVDKAVMSPRLGPGRAVTPAEKPHPPAVEADTALQEMKAKIEANSDYVGPRFVDEARAMHLGDVPERSIYGEATPQAAKALIEEGVPVLPLPFMPTRKTN